MWYHTHIVARVELNLVRCAAMLAPGGCGVREGGVCRCEGVLCSLSREDTIARRMTAVHYRNPEILAAYHTRDRGAFEASSTETVHWSKS